MGFGYGRVTNHADTEAYSKDDGKRVASRFSNDMVAHVWNAQTQTRGYSSNGNFYFEGPTLYSYGTHFPVATILPDGVAVMNADSVSVTTSGHQSDARSASSNRDAFYVASLDKRLSGIRAIAEGRDTKANVRKWLARNALELTGKRVPVGSYRYEANSPRGEAFGAYLASLAKLRADEWPAILRRAEAAKAKADAKAKAEKAAATEAESIRLADMPDRDFRNMIARFGVDYNAYGLDTLAKRLKTARGLALHAKRGKLAAASRLATLRERVKRVDLERATFAERRQARIARQELGIAVANVRAIRDSNDAGATMTYNGMVALGRDLDKIAEHGRLSSLKDKARRLSTLATIGVGAIRAEESRRREVERANEAKERAERIALWLAGESVGRIYFDAESGGAAMRINGDTLETSHGAQVPLSHAIKAFRFVKLCRERGEAWRRNGRVVRVGHFQIDWIDPQGNFQAGCHYFTWPEVERVAKLADVAECPPSADAVEVTSEKHAA